MHCVQSAEYGFESRALSGTGSGSESMSALYFAKSSSAVLLGSGNGVDICDKEVPN